MSDFTSAFWSQYVAIITIAGVVGCLLLLVFAGFKKVKKQSDNSTGHVWDENLRELNNPLPMWWVGLFVLTIVFSAWYLWKYPGLGTYEGSAKWTQAKEWQEETDKEKASAAKAYAAFTGKSVEDLAKNPVAMEMAARMFLNNCALCHGADAKGSKGFPNLADHDWLYGGTPEAIVQSITEGRQGVMPSMAAAVGTPEDVRNLAHHVMRLSGSAHDSVKAELGKGKFGVCAACHGADGKGNIAFGAPNLTDNIWLHGFGTQHIEDMINKGKTNQMPAQKDRYDETQIKMLAAYVWGLSNKQAAAPQ